MSEVTKAVYFRVPLEEYKKLQRIRKRSRRPSVQNVLQAMVALVDETAPEWNIGDLPEDCNHGKKNGGSPGR